jgi:hypothetical protein
MRSFFKEKKFQIEEREPLFDHYKPLINYPEEGDLPQEEIQNRFINLEESNVLNTYNTRNQYFSRLQNHFIKSGKKSAIERLFKKSFLNQFKNLDKDADKKEKEIDFEDKGILNESNKLFWGRVLRTKISRCEANATYNIRLKVKKRRRYTKYRVTYLERTRWLKKALLPLGLSIKAHKTYNLISGFKKEVDFLSVKNSQSPIKLKRDDYHKLATASMPYSWRRKVEKARLRRRRREKARKKKELFELRKQKREELWRKKFGAQKKTRRKKMVKFSAGWRWSNLRGCWVFESVEDRKFKYYWKERLRLKNLRRSFKNVNKKQKQKKQN